MDLAPFLLSLLHKDQKSGWASSAMCSHHGVKCWPHIGSINHGTLSQVNSFLSFLVDQFSHSNRKQTNKTTESINVFLFKLFQKNLGGGVGEIVIEI